MESFYIDSPPALKHLGISKLEAIGNPKLKAQIGFISAHDNESGKDPSFTRVLAVCRNLAEEWGRNDVCVVSSFGTLIEVAVDMGLLMGNLRAQRLPRMIVCRENRLPKAKFRHGYRRALGEGRLLIVSTSDKPNPTQASKLACRYLVAALAPTVFIPYVAPHSGLMELALDLLAQGKSVQTFASPHNKALLDAGAVAVPGIELNSR